MNVHEIKGKDGRWHKVKGSTSLEELKNEASGEGETVRVRELIIDYVVDPDIFIDRRPKNGNKGR